MNKFLAVVGLTTLCCGLFAAIVLWPVGMGITLSICTFAYGFVNIMDPQ